MYVDRTAYCALEAMATAALQGHDGPCTLADIAAWAAESPGFVASVMSGLEAADLVT